MGARIKLKDLPPELQAKYAGKKRAKFGSKWTTVDGIKFQSAREANRWGELKIFERGGKIALLRRQVPFDFFQQGKAVMRYYADFVYLDLQTCRMCVEDAKSPPTRRKETYRTKRRAMLAHGIEIREV